MPNNELILLYCFSDSYEYGAKGFCCCAALPPNDTIAVVIAVPTEESVVKIVSFATKEHITSLIPEKGARTYGMCMSMRACVLAEQAHVLVGYEDGSVGLWEAGNGTELSHLQLHTQPLMCMDYHAELCRGFSGSTDEHIKMWTVTEDKKLLQKMEINMTNPGVNAACFRGDGKLWVVGGSDSCGHMFSKSGRKLAVLSGHRDSVQALTFNDEGVLAVGSKDEAVSLWKLYWYACRWILTHCGLVTPYGDINLGQHWIR